MSSYRRRQARRGRLLERPSRQPGIAHDYQKAFRVLRSLPCEIFLASRSRMFNLTAKRQAPARGAKANPFMESGLSGRKRGRLSQGIKPTTGSRESRAACG
jgi:hypothetical protein